MMLVNQAMTDYIRAMKEKADQKWQERHQGKPPKLFISALGHCQRKAFFDCTKHIQDHPWQREVTHPFSDYVQRGMHAGNVGEADTAEALAHQYGDDLVCQFQIEHDIWSGRPDFFIKPDIAGVNNEIAIGERNIARSYDNSIGAFSDSSDSHYSRILPDNKRRSLTAGRYHEGIDIGIMSDHFQNRTISGVACSGLHSQNRDITESSNA